MENKLPRFKTLLIILSLTIILLTPLLNAGFFSDFFGKITGKATEATNVSITVAGTTPVQVIVYNSTMTGTEVDPTLLGGLQIRIGTLLVDGSLRSGLNRLAHTLKTTPVH